MQVGDREVVVSTTQFCVLAVLVAEPGRAELVERAFEARVDARVKELRRKVEPDERAIEAVQGRGYRYASE